jgi:hypothetical protein
MSPHTRRGPGGGPGPQSEHSRQAALYSDDSSTCNSTVAQPIRDIQLGLAAIGDQRVQALSMLRAAIADDIQHQVAETVDLGARLDDAICEVAGWWAGYCNRAIRDGARRARELAA